MGCCSSKHVCGDIYTEMLRRLRVEPTQKMDASARTRRTQEFERITSGTESKKEGMNSTITSGVSNGNGNGRGKCVGVEQLRVYDRDNWQLTRIHAYNAVLIVDALEDIVYLANEMSTENAIALRRCDYRMWLLYMCEFYHVMEVFEKANLLKGGSWEKTVITQKQLEKCLTVLKSQFAHAFSSQKGPGSAFHPPSSATSAAVMGQVLQWSQRHPLKRDTTTTTTIGGLGGNDGSSYTKDISTLSLPLVTIVRWFVLRHIRTFCNEEDIPPNMKGTTVTMEMSGSMPAEAVSWYNILQGKQQKLRNTLDDITLLEKLFVAMTHGTRKLSENDAKDGCYNLFEMEELFQTRSVHDELVEVAFRLTLREMHSDNALCITELSVFAQFLKAYADALNLYYHVMMCNNVDSDIVRMYGEPVPDLERKMLSRVLQVLKKKINEKKRNDGNSNSNDDYYYGDNFISKLFSSFATEKEDGVRRIPFLNFADAWIARLFRRQGKSTVGGISELIHALGLDDEKRRRYLFALLTSNGWGDVSAAARTFEALSTEVNLSQYCNRQELALTCAREQWRLELERHAAATANDNTEEIPSDTIEENWASTDVLLLRLLHGIYGTFVAVQTLANIVVEDDDTISTISDYTTWEATTPLSLPIRLHVLHETDKVLGVSCGTEEGYTRYISDKDLKEKISVCNTPASLLQYIGNRYVDDQMMKWRRDAWRRLQELWPIHDEDTRRGEFFNMLTNGGTREVRVMAAEEEEEEEKEEKEMNTKRRKRIRYIPFETLYQQYASELSYIMPITEFQEVCCKAVRAVGENTPLCLSEEDEVPPFLRYLMGYMRVLLSLAVPYDSNSHNNEITLAWAALQDWLWHEAGIVMDEAITYHFMETSEFITPHHTLPTITTTTTSTTRENENTNESIDENIDKKKKKNEDSFENPDENPDKNEERRVRVRTLAEWFALRESCWTSLETRLHIWLTNIRDRLPIHYSPTHTAIRHTLAHSLAAEDNYIPTPVLTLALRREYSLWRVWPPELGDTFVVFAVWETNKILQRPDLQGSELHCTDLRFVLRFIYTYLDVLLRGEHILREAARLPTETTNKEIEKEENNNNNNNNNNNIDVRQKGVFSMSSSSSLSWKDTRMHAAVHTLVEDKGVNSADIVNTIQQDNSNNWTTSHLALVVARASVAAALAQYMETHTEEVLQHQGREGQSLQSLWSRLRERLPIGESQEQRLKRKVLFSRIDIHKQRYLTLFDLHRGMTDILALQEFREELDPILFRAFFATKEVTFGQQDVIYLTKSNEHFITAAEFRAFLWYLYTYFQLYYMFDTLSEMPENHGLQKAISAEAFAAAKPLLKSWGVRVNNAAVEFAAISRICRDEKVMHFTGFAMWASQHHLSPEGYSHEEPLCLEDEKATTVVETETETEKEKKKSILQQEEEVEEQELELEQPQ